MNNPPDEPQPKICPHCGKTNRPLSKFCGYCGVSFATALAITLAPQDLEDLQAAKLRLEYPSLAIKLTDLLGKPIEQGLQFLPAGWQDKVGDASRSALFKGLDYAIRTIGSPDAREPQDRLHQLLVTGAGALGGALGLWTVLIELPVSTCIMLRSIADIARSEGHDISKLDTKLACLEVFALGGKSDTDDAAETGYWATRVALATTLPEAVTQIAQRGILHEAASPLTRFIATIAARFSIVVTEEAAATAVPIVGAVSGGLINLLFLNHFQEMARGHFTIMRLETRYGTQLVQRTYKELAV